MGENNKNQGVSMPAQGKLIKEEFVEAAGLHKLCLQRNDESYFVVYDYRLHQNYVIGENMLIMDTHEVDPVGKFKAYSNEQKTKGDTTTLSVDTSGDAKVISGFGHLSREGFIFLAGIALVLKALAPTCSLDECVQSIVQLAIKLKEE